MKIENAAYLFGGFAFGILVAYAIFNAVDASPDLTGSPAQATALQAPSGPRAPAQGGGGGGSAPMMDEIRRLNEVLSENPEDASALAGLGSMYHRVGSWDKAIGFYERAIAVEPENTMVLTDLGICYRGKGEYERALSLFERAHQLDPAHWESLFNTVIVAGFDLGRFDDARAALEKMERMDPPPPRLDELRQALDETASGEGGQS